MKIIPAAPVIANLTRVSEPFAGLSKPTRAELAAGRDHPASERRLQLPGFVEMFHWESIRQHLPLKLPTPGEVPAWAGRVCRSYYQWIEPVKTETLLGLDTLRPDAAYLRLQCLAGLLRTAIQQPIGSATL